MSKDGKTRMNNMAMVACPKAAKPVPANSTDSGYRCTKCGADNHNVLSHKTK